jgi:trans-aconitate methyltransferase
VLDLLTTAPRRLLDVGCGAGATSAVAKVRWPGLEAFGIELDPGAAERARGVLDRVVVGSAESLDLAAAGITGVDAVLLADVLEHLADPWGFLVRLRGALTPDATIAASIPNVANLWLIEQLAAGRFSYESEGLLDATHLRFFTRDSIGELFARTGYRIERWERKIDAKADTIAGHYFLGRRLPSPLGGILIGRRTALRGVSREQFDDLRTIQFLVVARPL